MNILHINPYSENVLYDNLYNIQKKTNEIKVYVPLNKKSKNNSKKECLKLEKNYRYIFSDVDRLLFFKKNRIIFSDIENQYNMINVDCIHAHTLFSSGYVAYKLKKKYGIPYIVTIQNTDINFFIKKIKVLNGLVKNIILNADKVVFIGKQYYKYMKNKFPRVFECNDVIDKVAVIPYGIDEFWINNKSDKKHKNSVDRIKILTVAEINENKNQLLVCDLCKDLIEKGYNLEYNVVGKISNQSVYDKLIENEFVNYLGIKNKSELLKLYRENDLFMMLSKTETFGLVYGEAISQSLPVLYTKGEGFDENFKDGVVGRSIDLKNDEFITNNIELAIKDFVYKDNDFRTEVEKFNWKNISSQYDDIYYEVCDDN